MVTVKFPKNLAERFKKASKKIYDREEFAILLGKREKNGSYSIHDLYFPPDRGDLSTPYTTGFRDSWYEEAGELASDLGLIVLGDIHSHCYDGKFDIGTDSAPSEMDWDRCDAMKGYTSNGDFIFGICSTVKTKRGLRSKIRFWPSLPPLRSKIT